MDFFSLVAFVLGVGFGVLLGSLSPRISTYVKELLGASSPANASSAEAKPKTAAEMLAARRAKKKGGEGAAAKESGPAKETAETSDKGHASPATAASGGPVPVRGEYDERVGKLMEQADFLVASNESMHQMIMRLEESVCMNKVDADSRDIIAEPPSPKTPSKAMAETSTNIVRQMTEGSCVGHIVLGGCQLSLRSAEEFEVTHPEKRKIFRSCENSSYVLLSSSVFREGHTVRFKSTQVHPQEWVMSIGEFVDQAVRAVQGLRGRDQVAEEKCWKGVVEHKESGSECHREWDNFAKDDDSLPVFPSAAEQKRISAMPAYGMQQEKTETGIRAASVDALGGQSLRMEMFEEVGSSSREEPDLPEVPVIEVTTDASLENSEESDVAGNSGQVEEAPVDAVSVDSAAESEAFEASLKPEVVGRIHAMRDILGGDFDHLSSMTLYRFLKARQFDPDQACMMLLATEDWRDDFRPQDITIEEVAVEVMRRHSYFIGHDRLGRPLLMVFSARHDPVARDVDVMIRYILFCMEQAIARFRPGITQLSVLIDYEGFTRANSDLTLIKALIGYLQNHYPERLGKTFIINSGWTLTALYRIVKPLLDERTTKKVSFVNNTKDLHEEISPDVILVQHGGNNQFQPEGLSIGLELLE